MPQGSRGEKRPADAVARAVMVAKVATGEIDEDPAAITTLAAALGKRGGKARAERMSPERRSEIARIAAASRWSKTASNPE